MKTYLNELHNQCKDSRSTNYTSNVSSSNRKDEQLCKNKNNNSQNKLIKYKSGLFLNNYFRKTNINTSKGNIDITKKKSLNTINNIKNNKKKKKINVTPYQGIKNEYILSLAMDNLNKYQEEILLKESNEVNNIENNIENEILNDKNNEINYCLLNSNNNILINKNKDKISKTNNNTQENFYPKDKYKNVYNLSLINKYSNNEEKRNNSNITNNYYKEFFINNDLFSNDKNSENNQNNNSSINESYNTTNKICNTKSYNNYNNLNDNNIKYIKNINNNINYEKNYENKLNLFINKSLDLKKEISKNNNNSSNKDNNNIDKRLIFILNNLELNELINIFENNYIFFDDLFLLTKDDFIEMKIPIGPRNRLINFIEKYKIFGKKYDLEELTSFMEKYKNIFINPKDNINNSDILNCNITPLTNNKYKSVVTSENNKIKESFDSRCSDLPGKGLNMSHFEEVETISLRDIESRKINNNKSFNTKNKNKNNVDKKNKIMNDINKIINNINNNNNEKNNIDDLINNNETNINKTIDIKINNTSKIKDNNNNNNIINSDIENNNNENNKNLFTKS